MSSLIDIVSYRQHQVIADKETCSKALRGSLEEFDKSNAVMRRDGSVIGFDEYVIIEFCLVGVRQLLLFLLTKIVAAKILFLHFIWVVMILLISSSIITSRTYYHSY